MLYHGIEKPREFVTSEPYAPNTSSNDSRNSREAGNIFGTGRDPQEEKFQLQKVERAHDELDLYCSLTHRVVC